MSKITYKSGSIINSDSDVLVNTVNCVGVMGKGVALEFKNHFPENYNQYKEACLRGMLTPGTIFVTEPNFIDGPKYIVNLATKDHWKNPSSLKIVVNGLYVLAHWVEVNKPKSVALPKPGCGNGGLDWDLDVKPWVLSIFNDIDVELEIYDLNTFNA